MININPDLIRNGLYTKFALAVSRQRTPCKGMDDGDFYQHMDVIVVDSLRATQKQQRAGYVREAEI